MSLVTEIAALDCSITSVYVNYHDDDCDELYNDDLHAINHVKEFWPHVFRYTCPIFASPLPSSTLGLPQQFYSSTFRSKHLKGRLGSLCLWVCQLFSINTVKKLKSRYIIAFNPLGFGGSLIWAGCCNPEGTVSSQKIWNCCSIFSDGSSVTINYAAE